MGTAAGGLIIKTSKSIEESYLHFDSRLTKTSYCDSRQSNCFYFGKKGDLLVVVNSDLSKKIFANHIIDETLFNFFDKPAEIFVFEEYDSGASYGYALFENGKLIRKLRAKNYNEVAEEFGEPLKDEIEWLNGQKTKDPDESILIKNVMNGHEIPEEFLYKAILLLLMQNKFSFTCETMADVFIESGHYTFEIPDKASTIQNTTKTSSESASMKKWWKIW
ncbi:MAG: hypothetical protein EBR30_15770 [Cytophagia bacterium]|nr:hypothetical protein [Cytophagia bacterium]